MEQLHPATEIPDQSVAASTDGCELCGNTGWKRAGDRVTRCECWQREYAHQLLEMAEIPPRYRGASLDNFLHDGPQAPLEAAFLWARQFVEAYPVNMLDADQGRGALLIGSVGTGKTHLATSILRGLIERGFGGRFYDYCTLLREIQATYSPDADRAEIELLRPVFETQVLVLDDLGATRPSAWVMDTVTLILNTRYSRRLVTLITTNFPDRAVAPEIRAVSAHFEHSLSDRVGERVVSRLREMCRFVTMNAPDYRMRLQMGRSGGVA